MRAPQLAQALRLVLQQGLVCSKSGVQPASSSIALVQAAVPSCWQQVLQQQASSSRSAPLAAARSFSSSSGPAAAAAAAAAEAGEDDDDEPEASDKVKQLAADIMALSVLECSQLSRMLRTKLGVPRGAGGGMMLPMMAPGGVMPGAAGAGGAPAAAAGGDAAPAAAAAAEKTEFDVKLEGFSPEGKIKVIKEIRALTQLGLKEAKELVEKAPVVIKSNVSKADAEAMKKQLEAAGGKVAME